MAPFTINTRAIELNRADLFPEFVTFLSKQLHPNLQDYKGNILFEDVKLTCSYDLKDGMVKLNDVNAGKVNVSFNPKEFQSSLLFISDAIQVLAKMDLLKLLATLSDEQIKKAVHDHHDPATENFVLSKIDSTLYKIESLGRKNFWNATPSELCAKVSKALRDRGIDSIKCLNDVQRIIMQISPDHKPLQKPTLL